MNCGKIDILSILGKDEIGQIEKHAIAVGLEMISTSKFYDMVLSKFVDSALETAARNKIIKQSRDEAIDIGMNELMMNKYINKCLSKYGFVTE